MAVDQSFINSLKNPDPIDWSTYKAPQESGGWVKPPAPKNAEGKFVTFEGVLPAGFVYDSKDGNLIVKIDPIVLKGSDYKIRFTSISAKQFDSQFGNGKVSFLANFVKSVDKNARPQTAQEYIKVIDTFARRPFKFTADWEAYDKESGTTVAKGYGNFPEDPNKPGERLPYVDLPTGQVGADGKPLTRRVFANLKIKNYIAMK
jgi:hypothetical protein